MKRNPPSKHKLQIGIAAVLSMAMLANPIMANASSSNTAVSVKAKSASGTTQTSNKTRSVSSDTQSAMDAAAESASEVSIKRLITEDAATNAVPEYGSDVSDLEGLFNKGQGDLLTPGSEKADGCLDKNSYDCQAVQVIYDTQSRPSWPESDFESLLTGRDNVIASAGDSVPGLEGSMEICDTITTTLPALYDYQVCEESTGSSSESCFEGWMDKLEVTTLFSCIDRTQSLIYVSCKQPYVTSIRNYTCIEAPRQSCSMGQVVSVDTNYAYQCSSQTYTDQKYRCNKVLNITGIGGCTVGELYEAEINDDSGLGEDPCNGGDSIKLSYLCSQDDTPTVQISTNWKGQTDFTFTVTAEAFNEEREFSNCKGIWKGSTRCTGASCITQVTMDVYYKKDSSYIYSGSLSKVFSFSKFNTEGSEEYWKLTCALEEGYSLEQ
ncbi:MAG: hypothetical protein LUC43_02420 [Burkholderiales bacterium]|nr:hypothetical protein [Burkholderiales bacterium]